MKPISCTAIALALAAGVAGGALAQGAPAAAPASNPAATSTSQAQPAPQAQAGQTAPSSMQQSANSQPPSSATMPPATTQAVAGADPQIQQAQQQLHAAGLYNGPQDGLMDPDTRMAIARFQDQRGLRRTEQLDQPTLAQLMSNQTTGFGSSAPPASSATPSPAPNSAGGGAAPHARY